MNRGLIRLRLIRPLDLFYSFHLQQCTIFDDFLNRENWQHLGISLNDLGGFDGLIGRGKANNWHINDKEWKLNNIKIHYENNINIKKNEINIEGELLFLSTVP